MVTITKDTIIGDILDMAPQTAPIFLSWLREKEGGSQREFAKKKEISLNVYKSYESGKVRISESF